MPTRIPLHLDLSLSWSRAARLHLPDSKLAPKIKRTVKIALETALQMAPPRTPALKKRVPKIEISLQNAGSENVASENVDATKFSIDFSFVDDARICELNRDFRGKDKPTDVLSFSLFEGDQEFDFPVSGDEFSLGDIVVSTETAARQAREQNHSIEREIAFLSIHGALHLLGYDHGKDAERRTMFSRQDAIFEAIFLEVRK